MTPTTAPYRTPDAPAYQLSDDARAKMALDAVVSALADLAPEKRIAVVLAASEFYELGLYDSAAHNGGQLALTVSDAAELLRAATGGKP